MSNEQAKENLNVVIKGQKLIGQAQHFVATEVLMMDESGQHFLMDGNGDVIRDLSDEEVHEWAMDADSLQPIEIDGMLTLFKSL